MHRTASVNEYSTRYSVAIDSCAETAVDEWRGQAEKNKQGSSGFVTEWPDGYAVRSTPGEYLSERERELQQCAREVYEERLKFGVAREQARKDLPLSNYTEAYWKIDLKNLMHFLSLRQDSHAQQEIREYADAMYDIGRQLCPLAFEAYDDYDFRRGGMLLSRMDKQIVDVLVRGGATGLLSDFHKAVETLGFWPQAKNRERDECLSKLRRLGVVREDDPVVTANG